MDLLLPRVPGLGEALTGRLLSWRRPASHISLPPMDDSLAEALYDQDLIGWDNFCFGVVAHKLRVLQDRHLQKLNKKTTGISWLSKLLRKIWTLQHSMWEHRNKFVHSSSHSLHEYEDQAVSVAIHFEFLIGRDGLPENYSGLFRGSVQTLLKKDSTSKLLWLDSVWKARDRLRQEEGLDLWDKDPVASAFVQRDRLRRKRKRTA